MSLRWSSYVVPKFPKGGLKKHKVSKIWTICCDNSRQRYEIGCQLLLITNNKLHMGFRLVPTSMMVGWPWMTLNGGIALILHFSTEFDCFAGWLCHIGWRWPIVTVKYCFPVPLFHFWPKLMHPAAQSLCDSWTSCFHSHEGHQMELRPNKTNCWFSGGFMPTLRLWTKRTVDKRNKHF